MSWTKVAKNEKYLKQKAQQLRLIADQLEGGAMEPGDMDGIVQELEDISNNLRVIQI